VCLSAVLDEYGGPAEQQSALNLITLLGFDDSTRSGWQPHRAPELDGADEKWHIHGGNDQVISGILDRLPAGSAHTGHQLMAVGRRGRKYVCTLRNGASIRDVVADHVVLTPAPTKLAEVDLARAGISPLHRRAIAEQPLGSNCKIELQFSRRHWNTANHSAGNFYTDTLPQSGWDVTNYQPGRPGIMICFPGGRTGTQLGARYGLTDDEGPAPAAMVRDYLAALERLYPGVSASYNGKAYYQWSDGDRHIGGAYSYLKPGQYTGFNGVQGRREGNLHFAGEATSVNFAGYMEGGLRSGYRAADEIAAS
jgi:monoamine oxidase